jgi:hypothetical protein
MIMLNEFVPSDFARRKFAAAGGVDAAASQERQLGKSRAMLCNVMSGFEHFPYRAQAE